MGVGLGSMGMGTGLGVSGSAKLAMLRGHCDWVKRDVPFPTGELTEDAVAKSYGLRRLAVDLPTPSGSKYERAGGCLVVESAGSKLAFARCCRRAAVEV